jgi:hypothetical protein
MRLRLLLPALLVAGCAHQAQVPSEQVVQLPSASRAQIIAAQQAVGTADQNLNAARVSIEEAQGFDRQAGRELEAAQTKLAGGLDLAARELAAAQAKKDYARNLIELRRAEYEERRADRDLARADFELTKLRQLQAHGLADKMNQTSFEDARLRAQNDVARQRTRVANLQGRVEASRIAWSQRARAYRTASRGEEIPEPPPPQPLDTDIPGAGVGSPPGTGANEGPSAPQSIPQD